MTPKMKMLEKQLARSQAPTGASPSQAGSLGTALEQLINEQVQAKVSEVMEYRQSHKLRRIMDGFDRPPAEPWRPTGEAFDEPAPAVRQNVAPLHAPEIHFQRDSAGQVALVHGPGGMTLQVVRNSQGQMVAVVPQEA